MSGGSANTIEHWYDPQVTRLADDLYTRVRAWGIKRNDVTVIGGAAVRELVKPPHSVPTQDIDIVLQSQAALDDFRGHFKEWGIAWRRKGRTTFKDCRFVDRDPYPPIIDVFTTDLSIGDWIFTMEKATNLEPEANGQGFLPSLEYLVKSKVRAVPRRDGPTAEAKRAKDLFDVHQLVHYNKDETPANELRARIPFGFREPVAKFIEPAVKQRPDLESDYRRLARWLSTP